MHSLVLLMGADVVRFRNRGPYVLVMRSLGLVAAAILALVLGGRWPAAAVVVLAAGVGFQVTLLRPAVRIVGGELQLQGPLSRTSLPVDEVLRVDVDESFVLHHPTLELVVVDRFGSTYSFPWLSWHDGAFGLGFATSRERVLASLNDGISAHQQRP